MFWRHQSTGNNPSVAVQSATIRAGQDDNLLSNGQWGYLPGSFRERGGLTIKPANFAIVEQDGSGGQANPAINIYGTHLEEVSDATITATMQNIRGTASVWLYGQLPVIADEFRVERKSVQVRIEGQRLTVNLWDGSRQAPAVTRQADISGPAASGRTLTITHQGRSLRFSVDGQQLMEIDDRKVFSDRAVWFGFDGSDEWFLPRLTARGINGKTVKSVDTSTQTVAAQAADGLQQLAAVKRPGFTLGAAMALGPAVSDPAYAAVAFGGQFGALTTENALKWQFTEPVRGLYSFQEGDALVALAERHQLKIQGHTLVFAEGNPAWVRQLPPAELEKAMIDHIRITVGHYKSKIAIWDVVNEPFDDDEWDQLRPHIWYKAMGENYISKAFTAARAADPDALLFINDYGLEEDGDRWDNFLALVTRLKQQGVPIDGVGFQAHVYEAGDKINPATLRKHMQQLAAIGVKARVSEMDVYIEDGAAAQAQQYRDILEACLAEPNCISWTTWGVSDRYNYFKEEGTVERGEDFLWNARMQPTEAVRRIQSLLR